MKIISWNVNSVRARITNILEYIKQQQTKLSKYNINVSNLIKAWSNNDWPHLRPKQTNPGF